MQLSVVELLSKLRDLSMIQDSTLWESLKYDIYVPKDSKYEKDNLGINLIPIKNKVNK